MFRTYEERVEANLRHKRYARRARPAKVQERLKDIAHAETCPRCSVVLEALRERHQQYMDRFKPEARPAEVIATEFLSSLMCRGGHG